MKKTIILLASLLAAGVLAGCSGNAEPTTTEPAPTTTPTSSTDPVHEHSFDEFGICDCGVIEEKAGIELIFPGEDCVHKHLAGSVTCLMIRNRRSQFMLIIL